jgi:hypothetical protein
MQMSLRQIGRYAELALELLAGDRLRDAVTASIPWMPGPERQRLIARWQEEARISEAPPSPAVARITWDNLAAFFAATNLGGRR